jgi:hypothetical protein
VRKFEKTENRRFKGAENSQVCEYMHVDVNLKVLFKLRFIIDNSFGGVSTAFPSAVFRFSQGCGAPAAPKRDFPFCAPMKAPYQQGACPCQGKSAALQPNATHVAARRGGEQQEVKVRRTVARFSLVTELVSSAHKIISNFKHLTKNGANAVGT